LIYWSHGPDFSQIINGRLKEQARLAGMKFILAKTWVKNR
jgi:hypothetical protein